jgi:hypothetical protein
MNTGRPTRKPAGRVFDAKLHLLDRQVVDSSGGLVCKVDDLEISLDENGWPYVSGILVGPGALGPRIGGWLGKLMVAVQRRLHGGEDPPPPRIDFGVVTDIGITVTIGIRAGQTGVQGLEDWMRENVIGRLPGASDAPE